MGCEEGDRAVADHDHARTLGGIRLLQGSQHYRRGLDERGVDERDARCKPMYEPGRDECLIARPSFAREAELVVDVARVRRAGEAARAAAARHDALGNAPIAHRDVLDSVADGFDGSGPLVSEGDRVAHEGQVQVTAEELQIGAADAAVRGSEHDLVRAGRELGPLDERDLAGALDDEGAPAHRANGVGGSPVIPGSARNSPPACGWSTAGSSELAVVM